MGTVDSECEPAECVYCSSCLLLDPQQTFHAAIISKIGLRPVHKKTRFAQDGGEAGTLVVLRLFCQTLERQFCPYVFSRLGGEVVPRADTSRRRKHVRY